MNLCNERQATQRLRLVLLILSAAVAVLGDPASKHKHSVRHHHTTTSTTSSSLDMDDMFELEDEFDSGDLLPRPGTYIPSNCSSCVQREELRKRNLEVIKDQILSKLGMLSAPNMTGRHPPRIPPLSHLLDLYGMQNDDPQKAFQPGPVYDEEEDDFHARTEKVISFSQTLPHVQRSLIGMHSMYFNFSEKVTKNKVDKAHLWLYLRPVSSAQSDMMDTAAWINVYMVVRVVDGESPVLSRIRETKVALDGKGGWVSIEVRKTIADWFRYPHENLGLAIQPDGNFLIVTDPSEGDGSMVPFVEVVLTESRKQRTKRTIGLNCDENSAETRCCRYPLTVDFVEFGWDWIIAPKKYEANYCSGECPYVFLQKYPHTHIVQQANPAGTAGPCCAPRKMSPISMLYFDSQYNIIYGLLPGMVVDRCGCS